MLFDLRGRGRRRTVQAIYLGLAILMGSGAILFGIGGAGGGLSGCAGASNSSSNTKQLEKAVSVAQKRVVVAPKHPAAWDALAKAQYRLASNPKNFSSQTSTYTTAGRAQLERAAAAWQRYLALNPARPDEGLAGQMVQAYGPSGLNRLSEAVGAQQVITQVSPSAASFTNLALLAYGANQPRIGGLAAQKALDLAPAADRPALKTRFAQLAAAAKKQGSGAAQTTSVPQTATTTTSTAPATTKKPKKSKK